MGRRIIKERRMTRREKQQQEQQVVRTIQQEQEPARNTPKVVAKNANQKRALALLERGTQIVLLTGSAGTGKSLLATYRAASLLNSKKTKKVYLVRPAVGCGKSIGLLPGEIEEKMAPYFAQTVAHLEKHLGKGYLTYCLEKKIIEMKPAEYMRGMSFEDCVVIVEEIQGFTHEEFEMLVTRIGENCQLICTGDEKQHDLKGTSGLTTTIKLIERMLQTHPEYLDHEDIDALDDCIGIVKFTPDDVVRSGLVKALVRMYYYND